MSGRRGGANAARAHRREPRSNVATDLATRRVPHQLEEVAAADVHPRNVVARVEIDLGRANQSFIQNCASFRPRRWLL
jgi:hypothetical protein